MSRKIRIVEVSVNKVYSDSSYGWLQAYTDVPGGTGGRVPCNPSSPDSVTLALRELVASASVMAPGGWPDMSERVSLTAATDEADGAYPFVRVSKRWPYL